MGSMITSFCFPYDIYNLFARIFIFLFKTLAKHSVVVTSASAVITSVEVHLLGNRVQ